jgi:hypothetical protein
MERGHYTIGFPPLQTHSVTWVSANACSLTYLKMSRFPTRLVAEKELPDEILKSMLTILVAYQLRRG